MKKIVLGEFSYYHTFGRLLYHPNDTDNPVTFRYKLPADKSYIKGEESLNISPSALATTECLVHPSFNWHHEAVNQYLAKVKLQPLNPYNLSYLLNFLVHELTESKRLGISCWIQTRDALLVQSVTALTHSYEGLHVLIAENEVGSQTYSGPLILSFERFSLMDSLIGEEVIGACADWLMTSPLDKEAVSDIEVNSYLSPFDILRHAHNLSIPQGLDDEPLDYRHFVNGALEPFMNLPPVTPIHPVTLKILEHLVQGTPLALIPERIHTRY